MSWSRNVLENRKRPPPGRGVLSYMQTPPLACLLALLKVQLFPLDGPSSHKRARVLPLLFGTYSGLKC